MDWFELTKTSVLENFRNKENFSLLMTVDEYNICLEIKRKYLELYKEHHQEASILKNIFAVELSEKYKKLTYDSFISWLCVFMLSDMNLCKVFNREVKENTIIVTFIWSNEAFDLNTNTFMRLENSM